MVRDGTRDYYDKQAGDWDAKHGVGRQNPFFAGRLRAIMTELLAEKAGARTALELGAGTGPYLDIMSPLFGGVLVTDLSSQMVEEAARRIRDRGFGNARAMVLDAMIMEGIEEASVDVVTFSGLLETIPDLPRLFRNMAAVLKPGGVVVGTTSNGDCPWYGLRAILNRSETHARTGHYVNSAELRSLAAATGLEPVRIIHWGACPPGLANPLAGRLLDSMENLIGSTPLSRWLGVLSFTLAKPV